MLDWVPFWGGTHARSFSFCHTVPVVLTWQGVWMITWQFFFLNQSNLIFFPAVLSLSFRTTLRRSCCIIAMFGKLLRVSKNKLFTSLQFKKHQGDFKLLTACHAAACCIEVSNSAWLIGEQCLLHCAHYRFGTVVTGVARVQTQWLESGFVLHKILQIHCPKP